MPVRSKEVILEGKWLTQHDRLVLKVAEVLRLESAETMGIDTSNFG